MLVAPARACGPHLGTSRPHAHLEMLCLCGFMQEGTEGGGGLSSHPQGQNGEGGVLDHLMPKSGTF